MRILVVDDLEEARELTEAALISAGYSDVVTADSAWEALHILDVWRPSFNVVLLDIMMPKVNGIDTCARIRNNPRYADLTVIMLTSLDNMDSLADAFAVGATDYITKPFTRQELVVRVKTAVKPKTNI
jgi:DNA-binding response OmpR family regulator